MRTGRGPEDAQAAAPHAPPPRRPPALDLGLALGDSSDQQRFPSALAPACWLSASPELGPRGRLQGPHAAAVPQRAPSPRADGAASASVLEPAFFSSGQGQLQGSGTAVTCPWLRGSAGSEAATTDRISGRAQLWNSCSAHAAAPHPMRCSSVGESGAAGRGAVLAKLRGSAPLAPRADLCLESSGPGLPALLRNPDGAAAAAAPAPGRTSAGLPGGWGPGCPEPLGSPGDRTAAPCPVPCESPRLRSPAGSGGRAGRVRRALFPPAAGPEPLDSHAGLSTAEALACMDKLSCGLVGGPVAAGTCGADADWSARRVCLIQGAATVLDCRASAHAQGIAPATALGSLPVSCDPAGELVGSAAFLSLGEQAIAAALEPADGPDALGQSGLSSAGSGAAQDATASRRITRSESCTAGIGPGSTAPPRDPCSCSAAWGARIRREPLRQLPAGSVQAPAQQSVCGKRRLCSAATGQGQEAHEVPAMGNQHRASASVPANLSAGTAAGAASGLAAGRTSTMRSQHTQGRAGAATSADGALACARRGTSRCTALHCCACRRIVTCEAWGTDDVCVFDTLQASVARQP